MADDVGLGEGTGDEERADDELDSTGRHEQGRGRREELIPTPEELEEGEASAAPQVRRKEPTAERPSRIIDRFRMRLRRGVGRRRKYVTLDEGSSDEEPDDEVPGGAGSAPVPVKAEPPPGTDTQGATVPIPVTLETGEQVESDPTSQQESTRRHETGKSDDQGDDMDISPGEKKPTSQRVGSVTFKKPRSPGRKPPKKRIEEKPKTQKEKRIAKLYETATAHGHSMGNLQRNVGSQNETAKCTKCGLAATLVADQEEMSNSIYWGIRGPALERRCTVEG